MVGTNPISLIDAPLLKIACPGTDIGELAMWAEPLKAACDRYGINNVRRVAAFIAQCAVESAGFTQMSENLNYSAERLHAVWPKRFPTVAAAEPYARNPEKLANKVYANRMGNGDEASGDGWKYRGGGPLQTTGKENWAAFASGYGLSLDDAVDYGRSRNGGAMAAGYYWITHHLNELADTPGVEDESEEINGGDNGLEDRRQRFNAVVAELLRRGA